ncbi:MAG TPA: VWA domain-containing protein [Acidobacteriaceae bacterium]|nr:VWA domain-containing protein [Acidobacteriaceae bacterium]
MRRTWQCFAVPVIFSFLSSAMPAQNSSPSSVHLDVVTQDGDGHSIKGLGQGDFVVLDNGSAVSQKSFSEVRKEDSPVSVMLVLDLVNGSVTYATSQREQLAKFLRLNDGKLANPTELTVLTEAGVNATNTPTTDGNSLADMVSKINVGPQVINRTSGGAAAQQRFNISLKALNQVLSAASQMPGRRFVLWLSPGWPLMSGGVYPDPAQGQELFKDAINYSTMLRQTRIVIYALNTAGTDTSPQAALRYRLYLKGVNTPSKADFADLSLQVLATQSGGLVLNLNDLGVAMKRCLEDAEDHYEVVFDAGAPVKNAPFHSIEIRVNRPGATARTRNGYYTMP